MKRIDHRNTIFHIITRMELATKRSGLQRLSNLANNIFTPMLRHLPQPRRPRRLEPHVWIEAARHRLVDDGLLLLVEQRNQLLFGADVAADAAVYVVEVANDGGLFGEGWKWNNL